MSYAFKTPIRASFTTALALALATALTGCTKKDEDQNSMSRVPVANASASAPAASRVNRSTLAVNLLVDGDEARLAIARHDQSAAEAKVNEAIAALDAIKGTPLVPIYAEFSEQSFMAPIEAAKKRAGNAGPPASDMGKPASNASSNASTREAPATDQGTPASKPSSSASAGAPPVVRAVAGGYSQVMLDTSAAKTQLDAAKAALRRGDLQAADKALQLLQQSVILETAATRMPLVKARQDLALASADARRGAWPQTKADLVSAANGLGSYAAVAPATDLADAKLLQQQVGSYASGLDSHHATAVADIDAFWSRAADLTDKGR